jgi:hypothetical protein
MRFLVETWVEEFEKKGKGMLPESWEEILHAFDGRRRHSMPQPDAYVLNDAEPGFSDQASPEKLEQMKALVEKVKGMHKAHPAKLKKGAGSQ